MKTPAHAPGGGAVGESSTGSFPGIPCDVVGRANSSSKGRIGREMRAALYHEPIATIKPGFRVVTIAKKRHDRAFALAFGSIVGS